MSFSHHKDLGNHLLQLCPKVVKHPVLENKGIVHQVGNKNKSKLRLLYFVKSFQIDFQSKNRTEKSGLLGRDAMFWG
jgi:hypothetical protein